MIMKSIHTKNLCPCLTNKKHVENVILYFVLHNPKIGRCIFQILSDFFLKGSYTHNQQLEAQTLERNQSQKYNIKK